MTLLDTHHTAARPVEIRDWVRALGRRLRLIVVVPLAAGALAGVLALAQSQQYRTTTNVVIPHPQSLGSAAAAVSQAVADFQGVLGLTQIASLTAQQTGANLQHVEDGLSSKRGGDGNSVEVVYVGTSADVAQKVVVNASKNALTALAQADLTLASAQLDAAKKEHDNALADLHTLMTDSNVVDFPRAITAYEKRLADLRDQLGTAQQSGDEAAIAAAQTRLTNLTSVAAKLKAGYQEANDRLTSANQAFATAQDSEIQAQGELSAAESTQLKASPALGLSRATHAAKRVIPAMIFGLVLAVGVVVLLELLRPAVVPTRTTIP
jgi:capsular polysaccharide biosynthesis protein